MADFASEILRRRDASNLSQEQLAAKADVARATIQNAERGKRISRKAAERIAVALDWPAAEAIALAAKAATVLIIRGKTATAITAAAKAAGKPIDKYLAGLLPKAKR